MKTYVERNIEKRKQARNSFEKDFWKLANNSVFGKTCENVVHHRREVGERTEESAEANSETELQAAHDLQRGPRGNTDGTEQGEAQQTELRGSRDSRLVENSDVRLLLRLRSTDLGTPC